MINNNSDNFPNILPKFVFGRIIKTFYSGYYIDTTV